MLTVDDNTQTSNKTTDVFAQINELGHEQVVFCNDKATGLQAIIAVHNTSLGPALGGTRFWNYPTHADAVYDVLRLSRGMTYKAAISGINLGGGKAVIIGDADKVGGEFFWRRYGRFVNSLNGKYYTAEDVGTSTEYMEYIAQETQFVTGKPHYLGGGGDPSPITAYGVYLGMKASANKAWGTDSLNGKKVLVEGAGHVGSYLVEYLSKEGADITVTDIRRERANQLARQYGATVVKPEAALDTEMDIYAPCALGATVNDTTIARMPCQIIAGAANNQLEDEDKHGKALVDKGIIYAPDFLINAGGVINCYSELQGYNYDHVMALVEKIYDRTLDIYQKADKEKMTTQLAAIRLAEERLQAAADLSSRL